MKNRLTQAVIVASVASALVVTPVFAEPSVDDLKKNKAAAESEVGSLQAELTELVSKISQLESDLIEKGEEITKAEDDLKEAQKQGCQDRCKSDQCHNAKAVQQRIAAGSRARHSHRKGQDKGRAHRASGHTAVIKGHG